MLACSPVYFALMTCKHGLEASPRGRSWLDGAGGPGVAERKKATWTRTVGVNHMPNISNQSLGAVQSEPSRRSGQCSGSGLPGIHTNSGNKTTESCE